MNEEWVDIRVQLKDAQRFISQTTEAGASVSRLGTETEMAGAKAAKGGRGFDLFRRGSANATSGGIVSRVRGMGGSWFHAAKGILAAGAAFASYEGAKRAVETTDKLAQATLKLTKNTNLDVQTASRLAAVTQARGIESNKLGMTLAKLSTQVTGGLAGQKSSVDLWNSLGVTQRDLVNANKDMPSFLGLLADRLHAMGPGFARTTAASKLFGRSWQSLLPLLRDGGKAFNDQLATAGKYGAQFDEKGLGSVENFIKKQREMKYATLGLQISFAQFLIPILVKLIGWFNQAVLWFRKHNDITSVLTGTLKAFGFVLGGIVRLIGSNTVSARLFGVALAALIVLWGGSKIIMFFTWIKETAIALKIVTAAQWLWNIALDANPIGLIVLAIAGLIAILVVAYKKVGWFRDAVNAAWGWIKNAFNAATGFIAKHWKLLLGILTFGWSVVATWIIKHWHQISGAAGSVINFITGTFGKGIGFVSNLFIGMWKTAKSVFNGIVAAGKGAINILISIFNTGIDAINAITPGDINLPFGVTIPGIPDIPKIPYLEAGGLIRRTGLAMVGERGPEVVTLPQGARVDPLPDRNSGESVLPQVSRSHLVERFARSLNLTIPVHLYGREVGKANARFIDDEMARA